MRFVDVFLRESLISIIPTLTSPVLPVKSREWRTWERRAGVTTCRSGRTWRRCSCPSCPATSLMCVLLERSPPSPTPSLPAPGRPGNPGADCICLLMSLQEKTPYLSLPFPFGLLFTINNGGKFPQNITHLMPAFEGTQHVFVSVMARLVPLL